MTGRRLATVALIVRDYDEAIAWFRDKLAFAVLEDVALGVAKRWVVVAPSAAAGARLLLAQADGAAEQEVIGRQAGGRVGFFLETDDFGRDHRVMLARGVTFDEEPRHEAYGTVAVFFDLYGNRWDLIEPKA